MRGQFDGEDVKDPTLVYSDGHLDTVGICIFLALRTFRAQQPGDPRVMVLDYIIISSTWLCSTSDRLTKESFADHQILILTHNGLFAHWCKYLLPGLQRVQIKGWSLATGPLLADYPKLRANGSLDPLQRVLPRRLQCALWSCWMNGAPKPVTHLR